MAEEHIFNMEEEFAGLDFNSRRLEKRFVRTMETLSKQPDKSMWFCSENRAEAKAIYRMLGNEDLNREEILRAHREATIKRISNEKTTVLAVQDTTSLNYTTHEKTLGLGYISDKTRGVNIHTCLAVTTDGLVLGILDQLSYSRPQAKDDTRSHDSKKTRILEEKESYRWVKTLETSTASLPEGVKVISVCDREGDMYELFDAAFSGGHLFLVRVAQNRMTEDNQRILDMIQKEDCRGTIAITIPRDSRKGQKERQGVLRIRYGCYAIKRPAILNKELNDSLPVWVIHAKEEHPVEDRTVSLCTEIRVCGRKTTGAGHSKDHGIGTNVFGHSGSDIKSDVYGPCTRRTIV
jgi:hypothetical protein